MPGIQQIVLLLAVFSPSSLVAENLIGDGDFEASVLGKAPDGWKPFHAGSSPAVVVGAPGAAGSKRAIVARPTRQRGWVALSRQLSEPRDRVLVEFSFAFFGGPGRTFNFWSHEPGGSDASQINLCIERGELRQYDGRARSWVSISNRLKASTDPSRPVWHRLRIVAARDSGAIDFWLGDPGSPNLPDHPTATRHAYRTKLPFGAIDVVSGARLAPGSFFLIDQLTVRGGEEVPRPSGEVPPVPGLANLYPLWTGGAFPAVDAIPLVPGLKNRVVHRAKEGEYQFLHGASIIHHKGTWFASWANSRVDENSATETQRGRRSTDDCRTWSEVEMIAGGFPDAQCHSHGCFMSHQGRLWTYVARFGRGEGRRFRGLTTEAFTLDEKSNRWEPRGTAMIDCWPYNEPVRTSDGNWITAGQDKDGLPVVAISHGEDLGRWDTVKVPYAAELKPSFAETTLLVGPDRILAVIRGGSNVAWVATSRDHGRTWTTAAPSNFPMPRAKAYFGRLSTGQPYLIANHGNRDVLLIAVGKPDGLSLEKVWKIRTGRSQAPRFPGRAKSPQWSYPYSHEHNGRLYVVYSIGKEDCGLSVLPIDGLAFD